MSDFTSVLRHVLGGYIKALLGNRWFWLTLAVIGAVALAGCGSVDTPTIEAAQQECVNKGGLSWVSGYREEFAAQCRNGVRIKVIVLPSRD